MVKQYDPGPLSEKYINKTKVRFYHKVNKAKSCWLWTGYKDNNGRGITTLQGRRVTAQRVSYLLHRGSIDENSVVGCYCGNRSCVNPEHLFSETLDQRRVRVKNNELSNKSVHGDAGKRAVAELSVKIRALLPDSREGSLMHAIINLGMLDLLNYRESYEATRWFVGGMKLSNGYNCCSDLGLDHRWIIEQLRKASLL